MNSAMAWLLGLLTLQGDGGDTGWLPLGETVEGDIGGSDPQVHTPRLDKDYTFAPTVGRSYHFEVDVPGTYTIDLRSYVFDAYLVLRDEAGALLAEDDDGGVGNQARLTVRLAGSPASYVAEACALHGERGPFELRLTQGSPARSSPQEDRAAQGRELRRAVEVREQVRGLDHPDTARALNNLAGYLWEEGLFEEAGPLFEWALAIREKSLGPEDLETAQSLNNLAFFLRTQGELDRALPLCRRGLDIREKVLGPDHLDTALSYEGLAALLEQKGDIEAARPLYERSLETREKILGIANPTTAASVRSLAAVLLGRKDHEAAHALLERAIAAWEQAPELDPLWLALALDSLGVVLCEESDFSAAQQAIERAESIREKRLGPEDPRFADNLNALALQLEDRGAYRLALPLFERALAIREKALGPRTPETALSLSNLAGLLHQMGDHSRARMLFERALSIREECLGPEEPDTATTLHGLALLLRDQGDLAAAQRLLERALAIREKRLGPENVRTGSTLNNLGLVLWDQRRYEAARPLYERALAIREKSLGPEDPRTAATLNQLAVLLRDLGDLESARPLQERALAIREKVLGADHPETAESLSNLAGLIRAQGDVTQALPLHQRALAIREQVFGDDHPRTALARRKLVVCLADCGFPEEAVVSARTALEASLGHARKQLWALSEREQFLYVLDGDSNLRSLLSLSRATWSAEQQAEAYDLSLAWRGLVSRSILASRRRLFAGAPIALAEQVQELRSVQATISRIFYAGDRGDSVESKEELRLLRLRRNEIEVELQRQVGATDDHAPKSDELRRAMGAGTAFVDLLVHPLYLPASTGSSGGPARGAWTPDHLSAWIVRRDHDLVHLDLGLSGPIEEAVKAWLEEVTSHVEDVPLRLEGGERLRRLLWEPLERELAGVNRVFVRPDSYLGTLPFEVIPIEAGRFLIEEKAFVYVQTPSELLAREGASRTDYGSVLAVGGVDFARRAEEEPREEGELTLAMRSDESRGHVNRSWKQLPRSAMEAETVLALHESAMPQGTRLLLETDAATEERLKRELPGYSVLHLATHGFFHPEGALSMLDSAQETERDELEGLEHEARSMVGELPGLLTGLVCAGASVAAPAGRDDGLLTAEEVMWLDLSKVELAVLSACETSLGERRSGEGMIGLRRAFGLAGAKSVVSSLWAVKDRATSELMLRFYENLWRGKQGRSEALRNAQLALLAEGRATRGDASPSTWAGFVLSGDWR